MAFAQLVESISSDLSYRILSGVIVEHGSRFVPNAFQLFPERYVLDNHSVLCVDYDMGAGKTLSASLAIRNLLNETTKLEMEIRRRGDVSLLEYLPRPYIIGNWSTIEAFEEELMRPEFGIVSNEEYDALIMKRTSEDMTAYEALRHPLARRIHQRVRMASYQKMFNRYFVGASSLAIKDEKSIYAAIAKGNITIDPTIITELTGSILIIDELQMLYSLGGWNTYGVLLDHIRQNPAIKSMTTIALSGTFINSSPVEMIYLYNLIRDRGAPRIEIDTYFTREQIGDQTYTYQPKNQEALIRLFDGKVASYRISPSKDFPEVSMAGELIQMHQSKRSFKWLKLTRCIAPKYQWEQYMSTRGEALDEDDEMMAHDFALPSKEDWKKYRVTPVVGENDIYSGEWLQLDNLRSMFGAIPARFIEHLLAIVQSKSGEKVVAHHRRLERGGLLQYAEALRENGFTSFGGVPRSNAICIICGKNLNLHSGVTRTSSEDSLAEDSSAEDSSAEASVSASEKLITDHNFLPATFAMLTGRMSFAERLRILLTYNSSSNIKNERIMCLLVSGVGEKGITLKATNFGVALGVFPGIPSWRQFLSRIARHGTHRDLPANRKWAKVITMVLSSPHRGEDSRDELRYLVRELNDDVSSTLWDRVRRRAVNCPTVPPENRGFTASMVTCDWELGKRISREKFETFYGMLHVIYVKDVIRACLASTPIWPLAKLRERILSDSMRIVPHNMSYTSDTAICEAIVGMSLDNECSIYSVEKERDIEVLVPTHLRRDDIVLAVGMHRRGPKPLTIFGSSSIRGATWTPISREASTSDDIQSIVDQIGRKIGNRERIALFDRIVGRPTAIQAIRLDFEIEGPIFKLLRKMNNIVWDGDDENPMSFARNRLTVLHRHLSDDQAASSKGRVVERLKPIGFIIGNEYHSYRRGTWIKKTLPLYDASETRQWTICAIFSPGSAVAHGRWHTRTKIRPIPNTVEDLRKAQSGMACLSLPPAQVERYMKLLNISSKRGKIDQCALIEMTLLEKQREDKLRYIYTPFETPPTSKLTIQRADV